MVRTGPTREFHRFGGSQIESSGFSVRRASYLAGQKFPSCECRQSFREARRHSNRTTNITYRGLRTQASLTLSWWADGPPQTICCCPSNFVHHLFGPPLPHASAVRKTRGRGPVPRLAGSRLPSSDGRTVFHGSVERVAKGSVHRVVFRAASVPIKEERARVECRSRQLRYGFQRQVYLRSTPREI